MDFVKSESKQNPGRRSFLWKAGAAMSAMAATAVAGISKSKEDPDAGLKNRVGLLEDAETVRRLHREYESRLDRGMYGEVASLFADDAEVVYNGGRFAGRDSIRRLYCSHFASGLTGKKIEPAPGFESDPAQDVIEVSADRKSAVVRLPYSMQAGSPLAGDSSLVQMARLQGEGIVKWWESGVQEATYVKVKDAWKIRRLEYRAAAKADYRPGRSYARPIDVPAFSSVFPADPAGPDKLV